MFIVTLGYSSYAIPDEHSTSLFHVIGQLKPVNSEGYGTERKFTLNKDPLDVEVVKVPDDAVKEPQSEPKEEVIETPPKDDEIPF